MFKKYKKAYLAPNQLYLRFGENVRALRREKHLSQEELSEMVFTTQKYISCIETGYMPAWNESGDLMPFSQWEQTETVLMDGWVQLNRPYTLAWRPYPADWELYALLCFRDVYGNEHVSHLIPVER